MLIFPMEVKLRAYHLGRIYSGGQRPIGRYLSFSQFDFVILQE